MKNKDLQVAVKSFRRELLKTDEDVIEQLAKLGAKSVNEKQNYLHVARNEEDYFKNEIIIYQILKKKENNCSNEKEREKLNCFVNFVGFLMNDNNTDPFVGSILTEYYPLGNLSEYTKMDVSCLDQQTKPLEIEQLVDFACQIAKGFIFFTL